MKLECHNSFIINIYYMIIYEVNIISKSLEDLITYTCFRSSERAVRTLQKYIFWHFWQNLTLKLSFFSKCSWWNWLTWVESYRRSKFQPDCFFRWWVIWVQSWKNLACSWQKAILADFQQNLKCNNFWAKRNEAESFKIVFCLWRHPMV